MKILHVIESGGFYGAERVLVELILGLKALGHESLVLSIGRTASSAVALENVLTNYDIQYIPLHVSIKSSLRINQQVIRCIAQYDCNLVHSHSYKSNTLLALIKRDKRTVPFCCTVHGYVAAKKWSRMWLYQWLDKMALRYMQHVFLVSESMLNLLSISKLAVSNRSVIENGIGGYQAFPAEIDREVLTFIEGSERSCIAVGRLAKEKGFDILIKAFAKVVNIKPTAVLIIFGDGSEKDKLQAQIDDLDMQRHIMLYGFCANVPDYFTHFDDFVMSSLTEGAPISLLEAMYAEMNCIATRVGSIPKMLKGGEVGHLIAADSEVELETILAVNHNHKGKLALQYANEHYSHIKMAQAYLNTYQTLPAKD